MTYKLKSVAPVYDPVEDRILLAINAGQEDAWSCWLTRRMALDTIARVGGFLERSSGRAEKTSFEYRGEIAKMERQAALMRAGRLMRPMPKQRLEAATIAGELTVGLKLVSRDNGFIMELRGRESQARGLVSRNELQTIVALLEVEVKKARWQLTPKPWTKDAVQDAPSDVRRRRMH